MPNEIPRTASARAATRATASSPLTVRIQGLLVALIAAAPLTVGGHYLANIATGDTARPVGLNALWLAMFLFAGVILVLAALSSIVPGWRAGGLASLGGLVVGLVVASLDWQQLTTSWSGFFLNAAGAGILVAALQTLYWTPRGRVIRIGLRGGERITEWLGGMLSLSGLMALLLPHYSTLDGVREDCAPLWPLVESQCFASDFVWWPFAVASTILGLTVLTVLHHDPVTGRKVSDPEEPYLDLTSLPPRPTPSAIEKMVDGGPGPVDEELDGFRPMQAPEPEPALAASGRAARRTGTKSGSKSTSKSGKSGRSRARGRAASRSSRTGRGTRGSGSGDIVFDD